ncbi:MAG: hypothetical protein ABW166_15135 [Sedimenticola sp.]
MAQLIPPRNEGASGAELLELLKSNPLTEKERSSLPDDLQTIRNTASLPPSPWES